MGILDKMTRSNNQKNSTSGFYFGHAEAEGEIIAGKRNLRNYFDDYLDVLQQLQYERFIFIGRKGCGKSAIAKHIEEIAEDNENTKATLVKYNEIEQEKLLQSISNTEIEIPDIQTILFEWIILVRFIAQIVKCADARYTIQFKKLEDFLTRNRGIVDIDKAQITEVIEKKKWEVNFEVLKHGFGSFGKNFDSKLNKAPFYKLVPGLKEIVKEVLNFEVCREREYFILFDDLDIGFQADKEESCQQLINLLRTVKNFNTSILKNTKARVLVFIRDDAKTILQDSEADTAKIFSSYGISLDWYSHDIHKFDENKTKLKQFINRRIALNFDEYNIPYNNSDPWETLIEDYPDSYNNKTSFKYIIDYGFYRPRDLILLLNQFGKENFTFPVQPDTVKLCLKRYAAEIVQEIRSELRIYLSKSEVQELFRKLAEIVKGQREWSKDQVLELFKDVSANYSSYELIKILLDYSFLTLVDNFGNVHIAYREGDQTANLEKMRISVHKSIFIHLTNY